MLPRRSVLAGVAALPLTAVLAACTGDSEPAAPDLDRQQLEAARDIELGLLAVLEASSTTPDAERAVGQHLAALARALGEPTTAPSGSTSPSASASASTDPLGRLSAPAGAADRAADAHTRALRSASATVSPLLASIAASDAAIASALRAGGT